MEGLGGVGSFKRDKRAKLSGRYLDHILIHANTSSRHPFPTLSDYCVYSSSLD